MSYFGINVSQSIIGSTNFFGERVRWNFGKVVVFLRVKPTVPCSDERSFSVLQRPKTNLRRTKEQDRLSHLALLCFERAYVNRVDVEKMIDSFSNHLSDQKALVI